MSEQEDVRRRPDKQLNTDTEAEHSMTSEQDQLSVEGRERARDRTTRARPRHHEPDDIFDPAWAEEVRRSDRGPGEAKDRGNDRA